jgi:hypothetical protein
MALVIGTIQYASADHSLGGQGIFKDENGVNHASSVDSKYLIHLQVVVRNAQGQLVSVAESIHGRYIPHELTDQIFDQGMGKKEIISIDEIRYEKVEFIQTQNAQQYSFDTSFQDMQSIWSINFCINTFEHYYGGEGIWCVPFFQTNTPDISLGEDDTWTVGWTIVREF